MGDMLLDDADSLKYIKDSSCIPYTKEEEELIFSKYNSKSITSEEKKALKDDIVMHNQKLVLSIAIYYKKASKTTLSLEDLIGEGNIGLITAVDKFDNTSGNKFSTYCTHWIKQTIRFAILQYNDIIRIPVNLKAAWIKIAAYITEYHSAHARYPSDEEVLANVKDLTNEELEYYYSYQDSMNTLSLNEMIVNDDESTELQDFIKGDVCVEAEAIQTVDSKLFEEKLDRILYRGIRHRLISEKDVIIFKRRYGFDKNATTTLQAIGKEYGLSKERIRQAELKVLRFLRTPRCRLELREEREGYELIDQY